MVEVDIIEAEKYWSVTVFVDKPSDKYDALKQAYRKIHQEMFKITNRKKGE